jgi:hypothetical protein
MVNRVSDNLSLGLPNTKWVDNFEDLHSIVYHTPHLAVEIYSRATTAIPWERAHHIYAIIWKGPIKEKEPKKNRIFITLRASDAKFHAYDGVFRHLLKAHLQKVRCVSQAEWQEKVATGIMLPTPGFYEGKIPFEEPEDPYTGAGIELMQRITFRILSKL